jgi:electron transport complex protein RnfG
MKTYFKYSTVLFIISFVACAILAFVNSTTAPIIHANKLKEISQSHYEMFPEADIFEPIPEKEIYLKVIDKDNILLGYLFITEKYGYSSSIQTMVGIDTEFTIKKIKIISQSETPGLGAKCSLPSFTDLFIGKNQSQIILDKNGGEITSITGATITSRAIVTSINEAICELERIVKYINSENEVKNND